MVCQPQQVIEIYTMFAWLDWPTTAIPRTNLRQKTIWNGRNRNETFEKEDRAIRTASAPFYVCLKQ